MSGIDEVEKLWILEYKEWHVEDYMFCYRGIFAKGREEAVKLGKMVIEYFNLCYNECDDVDTPDYEFVAIYSAGDERNSFLIPREVLGEMEKHIFANR